MFKLEVENSRNERLVLTQDESNFQVFNIEGLNPPQGIINTMAGANTDGARYNSSRLATRNLVFYIRLNGDVEANRLTLYRMFSTKERCKIYYKNASRDVYIEGYVETVEGSAFSNSETIQVSVVCPDPYFKAVDEIIDDASKTLEKFEFPFSINNGDPIEFSEIELDREIVVANNGESGSSLSIVVQFEGGVNRLEIRNTGTGEHVVLLYHFMADDQLTIDCNSGYKKIQLLRSGRTTNLVPYMTKDSNFFQLLQGDNTFSYLADDGESDHLIIVKFQHRNVYRGV